MASQAYWEADPPPHLKMESVQNANSGHSRGGGWQLCLPATLDLSVTDFPSWFRQDSVCSQELQGPRVRHMPFPSLLSQGPLSRFPSLSSPCRFGVSVRMLATVQSGRMLPVALRPCGVLRLPPRGFSSSSWVPDPRFSTGRRCRLAGGSAQPSGPPPGY